MSLIEAVHFRQLVSRLTQQERIQFLSKLLDSHVDIILTCLFHHCAKPSQINLVSDLNQSLLNVIQSRTDKPKPLCTSNLKLDQFPRTIIGYTASFLHPRNYIAFSLSSRSVYLGCNLPNTLQGFYLYEHINYSSINLASFPSVKRLLIDPTDAIEAQQNMKFDSPNLNQVRTLVLSANKKREWVQPLLNQNIVNCKNVTTLQCRGFGSHAFRMTGSEFLSLLVAFPNLTHLEMIKSYFTEDITAQAIADLCPQVVHFACVGSPSVIHNDLLKIFGKQLRYLNLEQPRRNQFAVGDTVFGKLEELLFFGPNTPLCNGILKSAPNLMKISVGYWSDWMNGEAIKNDIVHLMVKCRLLHYLCVSTTPFHFESVLAGIEQGLCAIKMFKKHTQHRKYLKISINGKLTDIYNPQFEYQPTDFTMTIGRIINALEASDINELMLIWNLSTINDNACKAIYRELLGLYDFPMHLNIRAIRGNKGKKENQLVITNKGCKINGYQASEVKYDNWTYAWQR